MSRQVVVITMRFAPIAPEHVDSFRWFYKIDGLPLRVSDQRLTFGQPSSKPRIQDLDGGVLLLGMPATLFKDGYRPINAYHFFKPKDGKVIPSLAFAFGEGFKKESHQWWNIFERWSRATSFERATIYRHEDRHRSNAIILENFCDRGWLPEWQNMLVTSQGKIVVAKVQDSPL